MSETDGHRDSVKDAERPGMSGGAPGPAVVRIASLREGDPVDGLMVCAEKLIATSSRSGARYLAVKLRDGRHTIPGRTFTDVDRLAGGFDRGQVVHVRGKTAVYRREPQIWIEEVTRCEGCDTSAFLPASHRDLDELDGYLEHIAREHVYQRGYRALTGSLLADRQLRAAWRRAACTHDDHHAYLGGLLEHTVAVATMATETAALHPKLNSDLLVAAAIVHDLGHTRAFTYRTSILPNDPGRLVGHLHLGLEILREHARRTRLGETMWHALAHCVLGHHGPELLRRADLALPEAVALYRLNTLDAEINRALQRGAGGELE